MELQLAGKVALVAGARRGVGKGIALSLAREGCDVAVLARSADALRQTADEVRALGRKASAQACDVADAKGVEAAVARAREELGAPTILVLSVAALWTPRKLHLHESAEARALLETDLFSAIELCRLVLPDMMAARFGRIIALSSLAARTGIPGGALYSAAKAGLEGLIRGLAVDYSRRGVSAVAVALGFVDSERLKGRVGGDPAWREKLENATAIRRIPSVDEVADFVAVLCSPRAAALTGAVIDLSAGAQLNNLW